VFLSTRKPKEKACLNQRLIIWFVHNKCICALKGILIGSLSKGVFERRASTGSEDFSVLIRLDAIKFVLLSFFTLVEMIYLKILAIPLLRNVKSSLSVALRCSKTPFLKFPLLF